MVGNPRQRVALGFSRSLLALAWLPYQKRSGSSGDLIDYRLAHPISGKLKQHSGAWGFQLLSVAFESLVHYGQFLFHCKSKSWRRIVA